MLLVRYAIARYLSFPDTLAIDAKNMLSSPDGRKRISDDITNTMERYNPGSKDYKLLAIFRAAISATDLSNLMDENEKLLQEQTSSIKA